MGYVSGNYLLSEEHDIKESALEDFASKLTEEGVWKLARELF
jgi:hypothetical protein